LNLFSINLVVNVRYKSILKSEDQITK